MAALRLTMACDSYDRTQALQDGRVRADGIELEVGNMGPGELFARMVRDRAFDVAEFSAATYLNLRSRGDDELIALPIFPSRMFRHAFIFVNVAAGIERPEDLRGRRVGTMQYQLTSNLWTRGFLKDDFGVSPEQMTWVFGGQEVPGTRERAPVAIPDAVPQEQAPAGSTLNDLLVGGEIDALFAPHMPAAFDVGDPRVKRLFRDYRAVETDYYRRTGFFPIMHVMVVRRCVLEAHPWVAASLFEAFCRAKAVAREHLHFAGTLAAMVPWLADEVRVAEDLFEGRWWPYGVDANRHELATMCRYALDQGIALHDLGVDALFAPDTLDLVDPSS